MIKTAIASIAAASAVFLGCGVAHADPVSDQIGLVSEGHPPTVQYLNAARAAGFIPNPDAVFQVWAWGYGYCSESPKNRPLWDASYYSVVVPNFSALRPAILQYCNADIFPH